MALLQAFISLVPYASNARAHNPWPSRSPTPDFRSSFSKGRQVGVGGGTECSAYGIVRSSIFTAHTEDQCICQSHQLISVVGLGQFDTAQSHISQYDSTIPFNCSFKHLHLNTTDNR